MTKEAHWADEYINRRMTDEDVAASMVERECSECKEKKLLKEFVIPGWWNGYQTWNDECHTCRTTNFMTGLAKVLKELPKRFPQTDVEVSILTPQGTTTIKKKPEND